MNVLNHLLVDDVEHAHQEYFSVCAPLPDLPIGNRFPYGVCGPFLDEDEARNALEIIQAQLPTRKLAIMKGCNALEVLDSYLEDDQERARAKVRLQVGIPPKQERKQ